MTGILMATLGSYEAANYDFELIAKTTVTTGVASIDFTDIPQTYKHLRIIAFARSGSSSSTTGVRLYCRLNNIAAGYSVLYWSGTGAATGTDTSLMIGVIDTNGTAASSANHGYTIADIANYSATLGSSVYRTIHGMGVNPSTGTSGLPSMRGGYLTDSQPISRLTFLTGDGSQFSTDTEIAIYGIKG